MNSKGTGAIIAGGAIIAAAAFAAYWMQGRQSAGTDAAGGSDVFFGGGGSDSFGGGSEGSITGGGGVPDLGGLITAINDNNQINAGYLANALNPSDELADMLSPVSMQANPNYNNSTVGIDSYILQQSQFEGDKILSDVYMQVGLTKSEVSDLVGADYAAGLSDTGLYGVRYDNSGSGWFRPIITKLTNGMFDDSAANKDLNNLRYLYNSNANGVLNYNDTAAMIPRQYSFFDGNDPSVYYGKIANFGSLSGTGNGSLTGLMNTNTATAAAALNSVPSLSTKAAPATAAKVSYATPYTAAVRYSSGGGGGGGSSRTVKTTYIKADTNLIKNTVAKSGLSGSDISKALSSGNFKNVSTANKNNTIIKK